MIPSAHSPEPLVHAAFHAVGQAAAPLAFAALTPKERRRLGGLLFGDAPAMVHALALDLECHAALFADLPVSARELGDQQRAADAWLILRDRFRWLAQRAADTHLAIQAGAIHTALRVYDHVEQAADLPFSTASRAAHLARWVALTPSRRLLAGHRRTVARRRWPGRRAGRAQTDRKNRVLRTLAGESAFVIDGSSRMERAPQKDLTMSQTPVQHPSTDRPVTPPANDPLADFLTQYETRPASPESVLTTPAATLTAAATSASAEFANVPTLNLDAEARDRFAGKRVPALNELARLLADGLTRAPAVQQATGVTPGAVLEVVEQDEAAGALATAGHLVGQGAADGQLLAAAATSAACERTLDGVEAEIADPRTDPTRRVDLEIAYAEPLRLRAAVRGRAAALRKKNEQAIAAQTAQRDEATQAAAESRLIDSFLTSIKQ